MDKRVLGLLLVVVVMTGCSSSEDEPASEAVPPEMTTAVPPVSATPPPINIAPADISIKPLGPPPVTAPTAAAGEACCSCALTAATTFSDPRFPCQFDFPQAWQAITGDDGGLLSTVTGPPPASCTTICPNGSPAMSVSIGTKYDSNADAMLEIWKMGMPVVGRGGCGEGTVQFFSPPGADETGLIGGVKYYVQIGGNKYSGAAQFSCGSPGGWLRLRDMFIDSFGDNPASTFPPG